MDDMRTLFEAGLKDIYFTEHAVLAILPKLAARANSVELRVMLDDHLQETKDQIERLEEVFGLIASPPEGKECPALKGLVQETEEAIAGSRDPVVLDAAMIGCAEAIEHYEIARYATLIAWAEQLDLIEIAEILEDSLEEEESADQRLTALALRGFSATPHLPRATH
ncbi:MULTISPECIES: DUF892 family protein [Rhodomicrobium]|uniref:YciE/YciF ferroxidase family protein n=1 Tax=Rhodomicrobium TaxID=1068 RepID=UPI000B4B7935|nr:MULTISPECIES: DUF892 family protein [Rhodomicrobium]